MEQRPHQLESDEDQAEGMTIQLEPVECPKMWRGTTLNSLTSIQQILFFLRKFSHLHALIEPTSLFNFDGKFPPTQLSEP